ncbi:UNVERIFIED_CONTAM: hypothetical protein Slati_1014800 [Sesamum latifolium]|uniref:CCHC-type domain-containing protein n=1 Tax=Sesamum latifolium TaxID=2727402 RepID=A0AAW2XSL4_9LAMI
MASELDRLGLSLSLTEEEEMGTVCPTGIWHAEHQTSGLFVMGRLVSNKSFHPEALHTTLKTAFNPGKGMEFKMIEGERFLVKFFHILDRNRVLDRCPWSYDKNLLVLAPVDAAEDPTAVDLTWCEFHIHIHGLSLRKMTKEVAAFIGNRLGKFKEVEADDNGEVWGSSVRIPVALDMTKALKRALKIRTVMGDEHLISFTYERLPNFCYLCGCLGHQSRQCELEFQDGFSDPGDNPPTVIGSEPLSPRTLGEEVEVSSVERLIIYPGVHLSHPAAPFNLSKLPAPPVEALSSLGTLDVLFRYPP